MGARIKAREGKDRKRETLRGRIRLKQLFEYGMSDFCLFLSHKVRACTLLKLSTTTLNFHITHSGGKKSHHPSKSLVSFQSIVNYSG